MSNWTGFGAAILALTLVLLVLTRRSRRVLDRIAEDGERSRSRANHPTDPVGKSPDGEPNDGTADREAADAERGHPTDGVERDHPTDDPERGIDDSVSTLALFANVTITQALFFAVVVAIAWGSDVPASAFGVGPWAGAGSVRDLAAIGRATGYGFAAGLALYVLDDLAAALAERAGYGAPDRLRETLSPATRREWAALLVVVLPTIAVFEETLFRGALVGAFATGFGIDPWPLAVGSSIAFGLGHGAQGRVGIAVTGVLGVALAAIFIATGSLLAVVVAHYVVNAAEFLTHGWIGTAPGDPLRPD
jgi:membrane protease YdiL (CAAX protease family)